MKLCARLLVEKDADAYACDRCRPGLHEARQCSRDLEQDGEILAYGHGHLPPGGLGPRPRGTCALDLLGPREQRWLDAWGHMRAGRTYWPGAVSAWPIRDARAIGWISSEVAAREKLHREQPGEVGRHG